MNGYGNILVVLGSQQAGASLHRAVELARLCGAKLHLCMFDHHELIEAARSMVGTEVAQLAEAEFLKRRMSWLNDLAAGLLQSGLEVTCDVVWAPVAHEAIIGKILDVQADLVIKDLPLDKRSPTRLHLSPLDWRLSRLAPASLMFVRPDSTPVPRQMLAAVQVATQASRGPQLNDRILKNAIGLARLSGAKLDALSVFNYMPLESEAVAYTPAIYDLVNHAHREAFDKLMSAYPIASERQHRYYGEPADAIRQSARELKADLIIIGSSYHSGWNRLLFGSTADGLLREIGSDVLILKPDGFLDELARHIDLKELQRRYAVVQAEAASTIRI